MSPNPVSKGTSLLFVCLGNICRSPLAEAAFRQEAERHGLSMTLDSAGIGSWHIGEPPDRRAQAVALKHGVDISGYRGRQVSKKGFFEFDHILALDHENLRNLQALKPEGATAVLSLLMDYVPGQEGKAVPDPYYGNAQDFEKTWAAVSEAAKCCFSR